MDRRTFLAVSSGTVGLLAGCIERGSGSSDADPAGNDTSTSNPGDTDAASDELEGVASGTTSESDLGNYRPVAKWAVPPQGELRRERDYTLFSTTPSRVLSFDDQLSADLAFDLSAEYPYYWRDLDFANADLAVEVFLTTNERRQSYRVLRGSFDEAAVHNRVDDVTSEDPERYRGVDVYGTLARDELKESYRRNTSLAVSENTQIQAGGVFGHDTEGTVEDVQHILDVGLGDADTFLDRNTSVRRVAKRLDPAAESEVRPWNPDMESSPENGYFSGVLATGQYTTLRGSSVGHYWHLLFEGPDVVSPSSFDTYVSALKQNEWVETSEYEVDGAVVTVTSTLTPEGYQEL